MGATGKKVKNFSDASRKPAEKSRILVADDHPIICQGLADLINRQTDVVCCGSATTLAEVQQTLPALHPDLLLLDLRLGSSDGLEAIKVLIAQFPGLRILVISQFDEEVYAERALRAGALGYVMKEQVTEEVLRAIRTVVNGQIYVSPKISLMAVTRIIEQKPIAHAPGLSALSDRELYVFKAIGAGKANKQIAAELKLSVKTVETYREHIKYKLRLSGGAELVALAKKTAESDSATAS